MGGCISSHASSREPSRVVLKILAEVNTLPAVSSTEPQQWKRLFHSLVPVTLSYTLDEGDVFVYEATASGVDGSTFTAHIRVPGTELHKTSPCFIQWEEGVGREVGGGKGGSEGGVLWGLNFMSEDDAMKFLKGCTPPTFTPESKKKRYSLPISPHQISPPPPPPSQGSTHRLSDSFESLESIVSTALAPHSGEGLSNEAEQMGGVEAGMVEGVEEGMGGVVEEMDGVEEQMGGVEERMGGVEEQMGGVEEQMGGVECGVEVRGHSLRMEEDGEEEEGGEGGSDGFEMNQSDELFDVEGDQEESDGGLQVSTVPVLYEPTSPLHLMPTGILHDIAEETDGDTEFEHSWNAGGEPHANVVGNGLSFSELEQLEFAETSFLDNMGDANNLQEQTSPKTTEAPPPSGPTTPPSLPISPPPGPVLSPRLSMLLAESATTTEGGGRGLPLNSTPTNHLSIEAPPPLPSSLPPGKLISPRNSLMDPEHSGCPGSTPSGIGTGLDFALLSQKVLTGISDEGSGLRTGSHDLDPERVVQNQDTQEEWNAGLENECNGENEEPLLITTIDEVDDPPDDLCTEALPPPMDSGDDQTPTHSAGRAALKITPSFLQSLEPPREFSDSGFPDTDHDTAARSTPEQAVTVRNGSTTASDERTTEGSGSGTRNQPSSACAGAEEQGSGISSSHSDTQEGGERGLEGRNEGATAAAVATRKAGWLELKAMLVRKNRKVAMKSKRRWRRFWATLKGSSLLFSVCEDGSSVSDEMTVDTKLDLAQSLAHAVHDHVKRDFVFCLSTATGNTYYMQTTSISEMDDWIATLHSAAAVAMTTTSNKEEAMQMIKSKIEELHKAIEKETQLKNLTELNLTTVSDFSARAMASKQLVACAENIERFNVEIYRMRCYMCSLRGTELPNPQTLLASVTKPTKLALGKLGVFSVASLHAIVNARSIPPSTASHGSFRFGRTSKPNPSTSGKAKGKSKTFPRAPEKAKSSLRSREISGPYPLLPASTLQSLTQSYSEMEETTDTEAPFSPDTSSPLPLVVKVVTPGNKLVPVILHDDMTIEDVLHTCCRQQQVDPRDHFVRLRSERKDGKFECEIPDLQELLQDQEYTYIEFCQKWSHTVLLSQSDQQHSNSSGFGLILEPVWDHAGKRLESVMVSRVEEGGVADRCGVCEGDEVMRVNGRAVREVGWVGTRSSLDAATVSLTVKTCHSEMQVSEVTNQIVESLICPAPPSSHMELSSEMIRRLTIPTPTKTADNILDSSRRYSGTFSREQIDSLLKDSHDLSKLLKSWDVQRAKEEPPPVWTQEDRLRKSAQDLVDTERDYVRLLHVLVETYLEPLQSEPFISPADRETLEGNVVEILEFQTVFLQGLEEALALEATSPAAPEESSMKQVVLGIARTFHSFMKKFRMYSTFCASHYKIKQLMEAGESSGEWRDFLEARNPRHDRSLSLPALFAKPIVRVARYPLFLNAMIDNTPADSEERSHLTDVVEGMTRVANYINEMQRISETYSSLFDVITSENTSMTPPGLSLSVPQLRYHGDVMWLNPSEEHRAGRTSWKKGYGPLTTCFVFASAVVLVCVEKKRRRTSSKNLEVEITAEDTKFRILLPSVYCSIHDLPDSDGVTNMWQLKYRHRPPVNSSPSLSSVSYLLRSQSSEQKSTMVHLISQSISEQCVMNGGGENSPYPPSSPAHSHNTHTITHSHITHSHNTHTITHSPRHSPSQAKHTHTTSSPQTHSSHFRYPSRPRSHSQPHLPHYTPSLHPSPLSQSHPRPLPLH